MKRGRKLHQIKLERVWARYPSLDPIAIKTREYQRKFSKSPYTVNWPTAYGVPRFSFVGTI